MARELISNFYFNSRNFYAGIFHILSIRSKVEIEIRTIPHFAQPVGRKNMIVALKSLPGYSLNGISPTLLGRGEKHAYGVLGLRQALLTGC
jgi:hypothetical protein